MLVGHSCPEGKFFVWADQVQNAKPEIFYGEIVGGNRFSRRKRIGIDIVILISKNQLLVIYIFLNDSKLKTNSQVMLVTVVKGFMKGSAQADKRSVKINSFYPVIDKLDANSKQIHRCILVEFKPVFQIPRRCIRCERMIQRAYPLVPVLNTYTDRTIENAGESRVQIWRRNEFLTKTDILSIACEKDPGKKNEKEYNRSKHVLQTICAKIAIICFLPTLITR